MKLKKQRLRWLHYSKFPNRFFEFLWIKFGVRIIDNKILASALLLDSDEHYSEPLDRFEIEKDYTFNNNIYKFGGLFVYIADIPGFLYGGISYTINGKYNTFVFSWTPEIEIIDDLYDIDDTSYLHCDRIVIEQIEEIFNKISYKSILEAAQNKYDKAFNSGYDYHKHDIISDLKLNKEKLENYKFKILGGGKI